MSADLKVVRETALARGDRRSSMVIYRTFRSFLRQVVNRWLRLRSEGTDVLDLPGPMILAPVHRSHLDSVLIATVSNRRIRALGKESLFTVPVLGYLCAALGAIPVRRGEAASDAMKAAKGLLEQGESMIVFPEGTRQSGDDVGELFDGAGWLAARTGARVVPIGIAGTREALPSGAKMLKRSQVVIVVGNPMDPPSAANGRRVSRDEIAAYTVRLGTELQAVQTRAVELRRSNVP